MCNDSTSCVSSTSGINYNNINQTDAIKNHFRIIFGLITKNKAFKIIQRYRTGSALIRIGRTTPGAIPIV